MAAVAGRAVKVATTPPARAVLGVLGGKVSTVVVREDAVVTAVPSGATAAAAATPPGVVRVGQAAKEEASPVPAELVELAAAAATAQP